MEVAQLVECQTSYKEHAGSIPPEACCVLEQDTLSPMLSIGSIQ